MLRPDTPALLALPHPVRVDTAFGGPFESALLQEMGLLARLRPYLADETICSEWIINQVPGVRALAMADLGMPGSFNMGSFILMLTRARLRAQGDPILEVTAPLQSLLAATDLALGLPVGFFRSPYTIVYIAFARPSGLAISNRLSGLHEVEGAYVGSFSLPPHSELHEHTERAQRLHLDPARPVRVIELTVTGSPLGKRNVLDDASQDLSLFIQDEDECLSTVLARHLDYYRSPSADIYPGFEPPQAAELALMKPAVAQLAKVLLYLNLPDAERLPLTERTDGERRLSQLGPKKAKRLERRLVGAYDRILIGPRSVPTAETGAHAHGDAPGRGLRPHWRRGHFRRIRHGEGLAESRLGWIRPVLVNAAEAFGPVRTKPYEVR